MTTNYKTYDELKQRLSVVLESWEGSTQKMEDLGKTADSRTKVAETPVVQVSKEVASTESDDETLSYSLNLRMTRYLFKNKIFRPHIGFFILQFV